MTDEQSIYDESKMKQKVVYPTEQTPSYADWALFEMGKELEGNTPPTPTAEDVGKVVMVGEDGKLMYGEGGGSGGDNDKVVKSKIFTDATSLYNFLSDTIGDDPKYIVSLIRYFNMTGVFDIGTYYGKNFNSDNFRISINQNFSMSSDNTDYCSFEKIELGLLVSEDNVESKVMQTNIEIENTSSTKDIHHGYYENPSSSKIGIDYYIEILYTEIKNNLKFEVEVTGGMN